jgi:hypothetical protein
VGGSKRFRGKPCAYCGQSSTGADHVIARGFFLREDRDDLPQVPTCAICNGTKSKLETDLMAVLPLGARHASAERNMREMIPGRLEKNQRIDRQIGRGQGRIWVQGTSGLIVQTMTLPVDPSRLLELHKWIARGLTFYHWEVRLTNEHDVTAVTLTQAGEEIFDRQFALNAAARVEENLKNGTFWYQGARAKDDESVTIWRFSMYGGLHFGDPNLPGEVASRIGVLTGPRSIRDAANRAIRFGVRKIT